LILTGGIAMRRQHTHNDSVVAPPQAGLDDTMRAIAQEAAQRAFALLGTAAPQPRVWMLESEAEDYMRLADGSLGTLRRRGFPVPPSVGTGKMRRYKVSEVDAWMQSRTGPLNAAA
jgi:hypothetical protein